MPAWRVHLPAILLLSSALVWRCWGDALPWLAWTGSILALVAVACAGRRNDTRTGLQVAGCLGVVLAIAGSRLLGWWPCEEQCRGAGPYALLGGIDLAWWSLGAAALALVLALRAWRHDTPARRGWTLLALWTLAGTSVYFLWLAWRIGLFCPFCFAIHGSVLAAVIASRCWPARPLPRLACALIAALGLHFAYHSAPLLLEAETRPTIQLGVQDDELRVLLLADRGRRWGPAEATLRADLVLDYQCEHCRTAVPPVLELLREQARSGRLELVLRLRHAMRDPGARHLATLSFAASAIDRLDGFLTTMLGTRPGLDALSIEAQLPPEQADTATFAARWQRILERLLELERQDLRRLGATTGRTPLLIIRDATGERARFVGELPVAAIRDALTAP